MSGFDHCRSEADRQDSTQTGHQIKRLVLHAGGNDTDEMYRALANPISVLEVFRAFRTSLSDRIDKSEL